MGKVIYPRKGEVHTAPVTFPAFAEATWAQVIEACQTNTVPATWVVGDQKAMTINGTDYLIDIIGKNHDTYAAGGTAPLTFQMHDCYGVSSMATGSSDSNIGGWGASYIRQTYLPIIILAKMPSEVQAAIKEVNKLTSAGNKSATINTTADKLFLLSEVEVTARSQLSNYSFEGEGTQYEYYAAGNSAIKMRNGTASTWWLRSPQYDDTTGFCRVFTDGGTNYNKATRTNGVSFAFCF